MNTKTHFLWYDLVIQIIKVSAGRRLLHEGELQRQTRKDLQLRYLILFSDTLLICRYGGTLASISDSFDADSLYKIPIDKVRLEVEGGQLSNFQIF